MAVSEVIDDTAFLGGLRDAARRLQQDADREARASAEHMASVMRERVPVLTGALKDSIEVVRTAEGEFEVRVGTDHGLYVEFGTEDTPASGFFRAGLSEGIQSFGSHGAFR